MTTNFSIKLLSDATRATALVAALVALYIGRESAGIFIIATLVMTLLLKQRKLILLDNSRSADWWEFGAVLIFLVNAVLLVAGLYYDPHLSWIDIPMHFWGGAVAGTWAYFVFFKNRLSHTLFLQHTFLLLGAVALIGVGWEFFEWVIDHTLGYWFTFPRNQPSVDDILGDLLNDLLGGCVGGFVMWRNLKSASLEKDEKVR